MVISVTPATGLVTILNVLVVPRALMVRPAGTVAAPESLAKVTIAPPAGAGDSKVTRPVALPPPCTLPGLTVTLRSGGTINVFVIVQLFTSPAASVMVPSAAQSPPMVAV